MTMPGSEPALPLPQNTSAPSTKNFVLRAASAAILAPLAIGAAYVGGWPFTIFWTIAALAVWWEWIGLVDPTGGRNVVLATGACALLLEAILAATDNLAIAVMIVALGVLASIATAGKQALLVAGGIVYASALLIASSFIRSDPQAGFLAIVFLFAVVWGTDIGGYFAGRAFGGPKLAPAISPKKTLSGAVGGTISGVAAAVALMAAASTSSPLMVGVIAILLSVVSQIGDLFESWLKRTCEAKDASGLIPGHGGVMDRLDGYIFAVAAAAVIGMTRGGPDAPAQGLIAW